jgi:hypothetical protein
MVRHKDAVYKFTHGEDEPPLGADQVTINEND